MVFGDQNARRAGGRAMGMGHLFTVVRLYTEGRCRIGGFVGRLLIHRKFSAKAHRGAAERRALDRNFSAHQLDQPQADRKTQTSAAVATANRWPRLYKRLNL